MPTRSTAILALALACAAAGPAGAATCHMTIVGHPVIDDASCTLAGRRGDIRVVVANGDEITVRRSVMTAHRLVRLADGRVSRLSRRFGPVVASYATPGEDKTCFFNQKTVLCVDP